jgi:hypothetical protein
VHAQRTGEVCYKRCITSPDSSLTDKQKTCLLSCQGAMAECFKVTVDTLNSLAGHE